MRRLLFAGALAIALHSLLFTIRLEGLGAKPVRAPRPLTLSLAQTPGEPLPSLERPKPQEMPDPPAPLRPQSPEEKRVLQKAERPLKRTVPSLSSQSELANASSESQGLLPDDISVTSPPQESAFPTTASLGGGAQGPKPPLLHEATPLYRRNPVPEYPLVARKRGFQGTVVLEVLVNRQGRVADLRLSNSSGYSVLDQAALTSVKTWLFEPGTRGEEKIDMWVKVPVRFRLE